MRQIQKNSLQVDPIGKLIKSRLNIESYYKKARQFLAAKHDHEQTYSYLETSTFILVKLHEYQQMIVSLQSDSHWSYLLQIITHI